MLFVTQWSVLCLLVFLFACAFFRAVFLFFWGLSDTHALTWWNYYKYIGGLGACGLAFAYFVLRESHPRVKNTKKTDDITKDDVRVSSGASSQAGSGAATPAIPDIQEDKEINDKLAFEVYVLGVLNIFNMIGWTSYTSMFAFYIILKFNVSRLGVGYISLSLATVYVFTNIVLFSQLSKRLGVYLCTVLGSMIFAIFLGILPLFDNLYSTLVCIGIGAGIGNGLVFPAMSAMAADYTNPTNRGKVLAFSNATQNVGMVIGPLLHGVLYEIEPDLVFYCASGSVLLAWCCIVFLVIREPQLRKPSSVKVDKKNKNGIVGDGATTPTDWKWIKDKPTDTDYKRLGKFLGKLLSSRNYNWVSHYGPVTQHLKDIFPPVRISSLQDHIEDIEYLRASVSNMRSEYDVIHAEYNLTYS